MCFPERLDVLGRLPVGPQAHQGAASHEGEWLAFSNWLGRDLAFDGVIHRLAERGAEEHLDAGDGEAVLRGFEMRGMMRGVISTVALAILLSPVTSGPISFSSELLGQPAEYMMQRLWVTVAGKKHVVVGYMNGGMEGINTAGGEGFPKGALVTASAQAPEDSIKIYAKRAGKGYQVLFREWVDGSDTGWLPIRNFDAAGNSLDRYDEARVAGFYAQTAAGTTRIFEVSGKPTELKGRLYAASGSINTLAKFRAAKAKPIWTAPINLMNAAEGRYMFSEEDPKNKYGLVRFRTRAGKLSVSLGTIYGNVPATLSKMARLR